MKARARIVIMGAFICMIGSVFCPESEAGPKVSANIVSVSRNTDKDVDGNKIYLVTVKTIQRGILFFGTLKFSFEVTDSSGVKYYGANTFHQQSAHRRTSECEWTIEVKTEGLDRPSITGYAIEYYAPDVPEPLDAKTSGCKDAVELKARNQNSKPLAVRGNFVFLMGGKN